MQQVLGAALLSQGMAAMPSQIRGRKHFLARLDSGTLAGSQSAASDGIENKRGNNLVRVRSTDLERGADGVAREVALVTYGPVLHFFAVFINGSPKAYADSECVRSAPDQLGKFGKTASRFEIPCFSARGRRKLYVAVGEIDAVVGILFSRGRHFLLFDRETFSQM